MLEKDRFVFNISFPDLKANLNPLFYSVEFVFPDYVYDVGVSEYILHSYIFLIKSFNEFFLEYFDINFFKYPGEMLSGNFFDYLLLFLIGFHPY